jgi:hypothetical protein
VIGKLMKLLQFCNYLYFLTCILFTCSSGQIDDYKYKRELKGVSDTWHTIVLPNDLYGKISVNLADIRIIGFTDKNDTLEAPYIIKISEEQVILKEINFVLINQSSNDKGYFFTFEIPSQKVVNQIDLDFSKQNFDWRITLEGSQAQLQWYEILTDYRILSIKNMLTDYSFTTLKFPNVKYRYLRLLVKSTKNPDFLRAKITEHEIKRGKYRQFTVRNSSIHEDKKSKLTMVDIDLGSIVSISYLKVAVKSTFDYYRPITVKYLADSTDTPKGWKYYYKPLTSGILSSLENNDFRFGNTFTNKLQIIISNHDNEPLELGSIHVKGNVYELIARFIEPAHYYMVYGNDLAYKPDYDIEKFKYKIPSPLKELALGNEESISAKISGKELEVTVPLFQSKTWLWAVMIVIIVILGWFSIRMIKKK